VCHTPEEAVRRLEDVDANWDHTAKVDPGNRDVAFMFSGQGSQYVNMGADLYRTIPEFRAEVDRCSRLLTPHLGFDLREVLYPGGETTPEEASERLKQTRVTQPALFVIEYALARCWMALGIQPAALVGHSIGEYVAACLADVLTLEDALSLVATRGRLMQDLPAGSMLAVSLSDREVQPFLSDDVSLAVVNGPSLCVLAGPHAPIEALQAQLVERSVKCQRLHTSHAFHSTMMEPILEAFTAAVANTVTLHPPRRPYLSNVTGTWITPDQATSPAYWATHLRQTVRFADCVDVLLEQPGRVLLEVGPGQTLSGLVRQSPRKSPDHVLVSSLRHPQEPKSDVAFFLQSIGRVWAAGVDLDWRALHGGKPRRRVPLYTYPFESRRHWIDGVRKEFAAAGAMAPAQELLVHDREADGTRPLVAVSEPDFPQNETERRLSAIWQEVLGVQRVAPDESFSDLGGTSLMAVELFAKINRTFGASLSIATLFEAPTVRQLAAVVRRVAQPEEGARRQPRPTTAMKPPLIGYGLTGLLSRLRLPAAGTKGAPRSA
jgi:acyl transferase domain-containing protein